MGVGVVISAIVVKERGPTPGLMKREFNRLSKAAWIFAGKQFHANFTSKRFTPEHAVKARYAKRKGQGMPRGSRQFARSYYGRKLRSDKGGGRGQADPLVFTGQSKRAARFPSVNSTKSRVRIRYKTPTFNRRHPRSRVRMSEEFRRVLPEEKRQIAAWYDEELDRQLADVTTTKTTRITG